uniref:Uncharacterized protein n=1 Tax=Lactuca sativa TaxID=4236 RepID=A0A9R1WFR1_LACSA|nr:hypothetical protein LSAT_V11C200061210 [Lactuca sativa]
MPDKNFRVTDNVVHQQLLHELEHTICSSVPSKSLAAFDLPMPSFSILYILQNRLLLKEMSYNKKILSDQHDQLLPKLKSQQM